MRHTFVITLFVLSACASNPRQPASSATAPLVITPPPTGALTLDQALQQGPEVTYSYLKNQLPVSGYGDEFPASLLQAHVPVEKDPVKRQRQIFIHKFQPWSLRLKLKRTHNLLADFQCANAVESQALALSLERDFPNAEADQASTTLHEKVLACADAPKQESLFRMAVFSIQKQQCPKALEYLKQYPATEERGINDRLAYLKNMCAPGPVADKRNPWGGYGIRLGDLELTEPSKPVWYLSGKSGSDEWDRLLKTFIDLSEKGNKSQLRLTAARLNYEKFRTLPHSFQAAFLTVLQFAGADLTVFQTLHKLLSDHPELVTREVVSLLFPVRYWSEIVKNSTGADPILVKSVIRQESAFDTAARSRARALGLMQLIYPTAKHFGVRKATQLLDPEENIRAGSEYLGQLINQFGSIELALAAYNAGPELVKDWIRRYPTDNMDLFVEMIPYTETREYVRLVSRNYRIYRSILQEPRLFRSAVAGAE